MKEEQSKLKDLEFLKSQNQPQIEIKLCFWWQSIICF